MQIVPPVMTALVPAYILSFLWSYSHKDPGRQIIDLIDQKVVDVPVEGEGQNGTVEKTITTREVMEVEKDPEILKTLTWGTPSPSSHFWSYLTLGINLMLVVFFLDHLYRAPLLHQEHDLSFARVGYVDDHSAKILLREPRVAALPIKVSYRYHDIIQSPEWPHLSRDSSWKLARTIQELTNETDYTASVTIHGLRPDSKYQYHVSYSNSNGFFTTAPHVGELSSKADGKFTFLHSSCILPRVPYNPLDHALSIKGFKYLASWLPKLKAHFMFFLGDFIYVDVPVRFGRDVSTYRTQYRQVYASPDWHSVSDNLPWLHVYDDHEIGNDWDRNTSQPYPAAFDPYYHYHVSVNPPARDVNHTYFEFTQGLASYFMLDTRRYRDVTSSKNDTDATKTMLGPEQLNDLLKFLRRPDPPGVQWKFVISSVPFTKNWRFGTEDTWGGYLAERQTILEAMWDVGKRGGVGVVVLSGDRHEFAATSFPPPEGGKWPLSASVREFSTSPLNMFYLPTRTYREVDAEDVLVK
jgi:alkaline phosphatase D